MKCAADRSHDDRRGINPLHLLWNYSSVYCIMSRMIDQPITTCSARASVPPGRKPPADIVGSVHRFGPRGVPYEVIAVLSPDELRIRVITTGEETTYALADFLADPED